MPAILSGKRVVISTGTKNLQEQLFFKDVPFLQQHFRQPLAVCYMKGRGNYLAARRSTTLSANRFSPAWRKCRVSRSSANGSKTTETGDRAEMTDVARIERGLGEARCPQRSLLRPEVPAVRPMLHDR